MLILSSENKRSAWLNRYLPKFQLATSLFERCLDKIHLPDRRSAGSDDDVAVVESLQESCSCGNRFVRNDWEYRRKSPGLMDKHFERDTIALINLARSQRCPWFLQFGSRGENCNSRL